MSEGKEPIPGAAPDDLVVPLHPGAACRHCGRPLIQWGPQQTWMHATAWDAMMQREIYLHCRTQLAAPAEDGEESTDELEREAALTRYFRGADMDWEHPDVLTAAGLLAFRAGWQAARA